MGGTQSNRFSLNEKDIKTWLKWAVVFTLPVFTIYGGQILGAISANNGAVNLNDFIPSVFTWGAITAYVIERIQDLARRFIAES